MEGVTDHTTLLNRDQNDYPNIGQPLDQAMEHRTSNYECKVIGASVNILVHYLIGGSVLVALWFAFKSAPVSAFQLHIGLSVIGYQLLMSHAILCLNNGSGGSILTCRHRHRLHWVLQLAGSVTAIVGSAMMIQKKSVHFNTIHGKLGLAALIFTCTSLINGVVSLYAVELRRFIPAKVSKISHIILGTAAFALSSACLAFGYNKNSLELGMGFKGICVRFDRYNHYLHYHSCCFTVQKYLEKYCMKHLKTRSRRFENKKKRVAVFMSYAVPDCCRHINLMKKPELICKQSVNP